MHGGNGQSSIASYELDKISLTYNALYTKNRIDYVGDYFPYGKILREFVNGDRERYLTTQHERDAETGFDYRGARYYDADVARFLSLDPLAADFASWSPYNYVMGNPVSLVDPDGKSPTPPKNVHYYNMVKQSDGSYKAVYSHSSQTLSIKSNNAIGTNSTSGESGTLKAGDHGKMDKTTNVYTYWNSDGTINHQHAKSKQILVDSKKPEPFQFPELSADATMTIAIGQLLFQGAALETAKEPFKYIEAPGIAKNSHIPPANYIFKMAGNLGTAFTIADKATLTTNALIRGDYQTADTEGACLVGYTAAAAMMAAPTGITQVGGAILFLGTGIYDLCTD